MTAVFHRQLAAPPPVAVSGKGAYIIDERGNRYLDASSGAAVSCLGHGHARVLEAIRAQLDRIAYVHSGFFTTQPAEELAADLTADAPAGLSKVLFTSGGSEAVEAAIKIARQYFVETGAASRRYVVARRQSYHGNTLGALSAGGNLHRRATYEPMLADCFRHIPPCYAYRESQPGESPEAYGRRAADTLEQTILELGPANVAAFIAEPVVGATLGAVPAAPGYFARIREICDRHGVLLILDEVMCGMGRTGTRYACEADGIAPDMVAIAKGLGGGYQPIGAVVVSGGIHEAIDRASGVLEHGHTYMGHATACAAALAVQQVIREEGVLENVVSQGAALHEILEERFGDHLHVGDIRGRGLLQAIELVADRETKEPFDSALKVHTRIRHRALELGLICYPMGGTVDGQRGDHVLIAPPFIVGAAEIEQIADLLGQALDDVLGETARAAGAVADSESRAA